MTTNEHDAKQSGKLRECPFCGGKAISGMFAVWCEHCTAEINGRNQDIDESIILWNTRADDALMDEMEAALDAMIGLADCYDDDDCAAYDRAQNVLASVRERKAGK
jgi:hypothetical protein